MASKVPLVVRRIEPVALLGKSNTMAWTADRDLFPVRVRSDIRAQGDDQEQTSQGKQANH